MPFTPKKALIISVGGSFEPVFKALEHHRPDFVVFLISQESLEVRNKVVQTARSAGLEFESKVSITEDEADLVECYKKSELAIQKALESGFSTGQLFVDYTPGTKTMSVALALASAPVRIQSFSYISGSQRTKDGLGVVKDGTELPIRNANPWEYFSIFERRSLTILWNQFQFKQCATLLEKLIENVGPHRRFFKDLLVAAQGFHFWDLFQYDLAFRKLASIDFPSYLPGDDKTIFTFMQDIHKSKELLEKINTSLYGGIKKGRNYEPSPSRELILDLVSNSERRFEEGQVEDAIVRLYRTLELIAQLELKTHYNIDTSNVLVGQLPTEFLSKYEIKPIGVKTPIKIGLEKSYFLLKFLGHQLGKLYSQQEASFRKVQFARNSSILIHGFETSDSNKAFDSLYKRILGLNYFQEDELYHFPVLQDLYELDTD